MSGRGFLGLIVGLFTLVVLSAVTLITVVVTLQALLAPTPQTRMPVLLGILAGCVLAWAVLVRWHRAKLARTRTRTRTRALEGEAASGGSPPQTPQGGAETARG